ncbi:hypothetical protein F1737_01650 [Methanoplanus sp. FWC-SCC4]|uniref:UPF0146 protein F1737_01650 n=1 Tax=Methanochimaera problematica TaxID=2609417 RepID=A0AA97F9W1_9EURY|nr:UPF0146 family protein [Methanoplanus sp. FWC-SCC4]WOF15475.1 hypothetical protein F1737_01650 [Methanoplanus sp. FWC-SCC4]
MDYYKSIEEAIYTYISANYKNRKIIEVGIGKNPDIFFSLQKNGFDVSAVDIKTNLPDYGENFHQDDVFEPDISLYNGCNLIYSVRPGIEMIPSLVNIAKEAGSELIVYHLGNEIYQNGGEKIECGVILNRYYKP